MNHNQIELAILVKGKPITEYNHRGQVFIEGRAGSEYEIEIRNNSYGRVEAVLSVDGLSVIDGKPAGVQSSGYMIEGRKSIRIPGWTLDKDNVAKFAFSGKGESYSTQMSGGDARNNGVIGVMAFAEKAATTYYPQPVTWNYPQPFFGAVSNNIGGPVSGWQSYRSSHAKGMYGSQEVKTSGGSIASLSAAPRGISPSVNSYEVDQSYIASASASFDAMPQNAQMSQSLNSLGTAFGDATEFATTKVEFVRGDLLSMMVLYYDEARGLKARGIQMVRPSKKKYQTQPDAFPGMSPEGCVPPPNWRG